LTGLATHRRGFPHRRGTAARRTDAEADWSEAVATFESHPAWVGAKFERRGERYKITDAPCALRCGYQFAPLDLEALEGWFDTVAGVHVGVGALRKAVAFMAT
jgi:hypothetical protein